MNTLNLNSLVDFARYEAVSLVIEYSEPDDTFSVEVQSSAPSENFYRKRVAHAEGFIAERRISSNRTGFVK